MGESVTFSEFVTCKCISCKYNFDQNRSLILEMLLSSIFLKENLTFKISKDSKFFQNFKIKISKFHNQDPKFQKTHYK